MKPQFLKIKNFKSIGNKGQIIELSPITLLFGPNSAGKSTVLQSLIYLREILLNKNLDPDKTELGDYDENGIPDLMVKFERAAFESLLSPGTAEVTLYGGGEGIYFQGVDTVKVK